MSKYSFEVHCMKKCRWRKGFSRQKLKLGNSVFKEAACVCGGFKEEAEEEGL